MTQNEKFDKMLRNYCNRDVEAFEFKSKKNTVKFTSLVAACLVFVILLSILIVPELYPQNEFTLTASAASECELKYFTEKELNYFTVGSKEIIPEGVSFKISGENIKEIYAYSEKEYLALAISSWPREYNIVDINFRDKGESKIVDMPTLLIVPFEKDSNDELTIVRKSNMYVSHLKVIDELQTEGEKDITITSIPIDENRKFIYKDYSEKYNDRIIIEITYFDGTKETKSKEVTYKDGKIVF